MRDLLRTANAPEPVMKCFIKHAKSWVCPKTVALSLLSDKAPKNDFSRLAPRELEMEDLLRSNRPLSAFHTLESATSPCMVYGTKADWKAFRNNNQCCERLIGFVKKCSFQPNSPRSQSRKL